MDQACHRPGPLLVGFEILRICFADCTFISAMSWVRRVQFFLRSAQYIATHPVKWDEAETHLGSCTASESSELFATFSIPGFLSVYGRNGYHQPSGDIFSVPERSQSCHCNGQRNFDKFRKMKSLATCGSARVGVFLRDTRNVQIRTMPAAQGCYYL